jgi:hypothetical protein
MNVLPLISLVLATSLPVLAVAQDSLRRPARSVASLPAPAAAGPLRILLVDDDLSDNNNIPGDKRLSPSDRVFRQLVADAVGGDANGWSIEIVRQYASGPSLDRLRRYSLVLWYTGASYGGNPDNTAVLSIEDEKAVRRYLEEVGGVVVLVSPGYVGKVLSSDDTWEKSKWPFLTEVLGIRGGRGLAQRFIPGTVTAPDGARFSVDKGNATVETQFSFVNPASAAVLFSTLPVGAKPGSPATPVATSHAYGRGRFVYVGFTFENLAVAELTPAFGKILTATGLQRTASPAVAAAPAATAPLAASVPEAEPATVQVSGSPAAAEVRWTHQTATVTNVALGGSGQTSARVKPKPAATQAATVKVERLVPNAAAVRLSVASPDVIQANDAGPFAPGRPVTYRVTLTDGQGRAGYKEASFTPQAKDPDTLTATPQADGTIVLVWPEVPGVLSYQVSGTALAAPVTVNKATEWRSPAQAPGAQQWRIASVYEPGGVLTASSAWPSANSRVIPTPGRPFLSMPNGPGSIGESTAMYDKQCETTKGEPKRNFNCPDATWFLSLSPSWSNVYLSQYGGGAIAGDWPSVGFADLNDLGLGRRVNCAVLIATPRMTMCWATSHGHLPAPGQAPNGTALAAAGQGMVDIKSLNIIITSAQGSFFGTWEPAKAATGGGEAAFSDASGKRYLTALDSQGPKSVPNACLSCHGGRYDPTRQIVVGASLMPLIPSHLHFGSPQARSNSEESIRRINFMILESNPSPTVSAQIRTLYNGTPGTPGTRANDAAVPAGWASQPGLYRQVIAPYCGTCHFSQTGLLHFGTFANLQFNKQRVQKAVCTDFSMPHSEQGFRRFWSEGGSVSLPGMLSTVLGFPKCPT